ncbi:vWA domain-containing protein [Desertibaculum subflavum]|uniref:vWA domain-containing protein n=1 Tax=Desertibaculum subflavum TaxID=2268458 RepID=UPI000E66A7EC
MNAPASPTPSPSPTPKGRFAENIMHFARVLREAGLPIGPGKVIDAIRATETAGIRRRDDFYWTLHSVFVNRRDQRELFDQAFHIFWRNPKILEKMIGMMLPETEVPAEETPEKREAGRRVTDALLPKSGEGEEPSEKKEELEFDASFTFSAQEVLQTMDFETMSAEEEAAAKQAIARMRLPIADVPTRRLHPDPRGRRVDMRSTLRNSLRTPGAINLRRRERERRHPPLVVLCDISGSMSRYSRLFLHFMHAITNDRDRVHTFLFGTRLTNVTRYLRQRDVDVALGKVAAAVEDWSGGTRIGTTLHEFNRRWSRRVLGQGALVLLITDGLDRDGGAGLEEEIERLHKSCRRLIWLNPLLRWEGFQPKALGIRAILPHVDEFRPVHNLESLGSLVDVLSRPVPRRDDRKASFNEPAAALHS